MYYVYGRPLEPTLKFFEDKWGKRLPDLAQANSQVLQAGHNLGDTMETARNRYQVAKAPVQAGVYRKISGNEALVYGLVAAAKLPSVNFYIQVIPLLLLLLFWKVFPILRNLE